MNARFTDGKFYAAFIAKVNGDGTYDVYYAEDSKIQENLKSTDIKKPITKGKGSVHWNKYRGKTFSDPGGVDPKTKKHLEPGEFKVGDPTTDQNFICTRIGGDGRDEVFDIGYVIKRVRLYEEE